jgi:hypothetical protein
MDSQKKWAWSGKLNDCNGRICQLHVGDQGKDGKAPFLVEIAERDGRAVRREGTCETITEGGLVRIRSSISPEKGGETITWEASLRAAEPGRYAKKAMYGTYESTGALTDSLLSRGVIVLWQFV